MVGICQPRIVFLSKFMIQNKLVIVMENSDQENSDLWG
jgi:hypothetical protein